MRDQIHTLYITNRPENIFLYDSLAKVVADMPEMRNQRADAMAYLEEHKILKLFDILGVKLAQQVPNTRTFSI